MNQTQFKQTLQELTYRRREVLMEVLAGQSDAEIAQSLHITEATVRKHIENICKKFGIESDFPDERRSKRPDLISLFRKYQPEWVHTDNQVEAETLDPLFDPTSLATIYNRDVFILIDRSGSMVRKDNDTRGLARYQFLQEEVESHVWAILSQTSASGKRSLQKICDRLTIYFFCRDEVGAGPYIVEDASEVQKLFQKHPPKGNTFITPTLQQCVQTWIDRSQPQGRGAFFIIYTDGLFDDESEFVRCISQACSYITDRRTIKFIILGLGEEINKEHFLALDFNVNQQNKFNVLVFDLLAEVDNLIEVLERQLVDNPELVFPAWVLSRYPEFVQKVVATRHQDKARKPNTH